MHWLAHVLGMDDLSGPFYGFWSGAGSDLGELAIVGSMLGVYRKHNCHVRGCWRIARHQIAGTDWVVCRRHHPDLPNRAPTATDITAATPQGGAP